MSKIKPFSALVPPATEYMTIQDYLDLGLKVMQLRNNISRDPETNAKIALNPKTGKQEWIKVKGKPTNRPDYGIPAWKGKTEFTITDQNAACAILCGEVSGLVAIDCDTQQATETIIEAIKKHHKANGLSMDPYRYV